MAGRAIDDMVKVGDKLTHVDGTALSGYVLLLAVLLLFSFARVL